MNERVAASRGAFAGMLSQIGSFVAGQVIFALMARAMMMLEQQIKDVATKTTAWDDTLVQLNAVLASTHQVAGWTRDDAIKLADSLSTLTRFNNQAVLSAENLLLTFTAIGRDIMPQATETVLNMATALHEDTKSAAIQLGKALQDPILGITALRRVGVNFSTEQKKMVKDWVEHGQKAKAVALILNELQTEFGGSARAAGTDLSGKLAILNNQFDIIKQTIGNDMIPVLTGFLEHLIPLIAAISHGLPGALDTAGKFLGNFFGSINKTVEGTRGQMIPAMQDMSKAFNTTLGPAIQQVGGWIMEHLIPTIVTLEAWFATKIMPVILAVASIIMTDFMPTIEQLANKIMQKLLPPLQRIIADAMPALIPLFKLLGWIFTNVVGPALGFLIDQLGNVLNFIAYVTDALNYLFTHLKQTQQAVTAVFHAVHVPGFAEGGVAPGGLAVVGERGPEIVSLPAGSRVYPNGTAPQSASMTGGAPQPIVLQIDGRTLARLVLPPMVQEIRQHAAIRNQ